MKTWVSRSAVAVLLCALCGCGETFGGLLYHFNVVSPPKVPARFTLASGPLLILVDDDLELLTWPPAQDLLADQIARELRDHKVNEQALASNAVKPLRQIDPDFADRSISELGVKCGAEQVLWMQVKDFAATKDVESISRAARFTVCVKVFNPHAVNKSEMRLWPAQREGEFVTVEKSAAHVTPLATDEDVARMLVGEMARDVGRMFYGYTPED